MPGAVPKINLALSALPVILALCEFEEAKFFAFHARQPAFNEASGTLLRSAP
jgi:hypothetical protein